MKHLSAITTVVRVFLLAFLFASEIPGASAHEGDTRWHGVPKVWPIALTRLDLSLSKKVA